ncbi:MAG TPA: toll/interleukin-1 receptor domain-containing protein [Noviherbaspirillum sp.]|nr:toll/interleukin-1 receptor domain-containing protein [Noviherbaspirillum sp.]
MAASFPHRSPETVNFFISYTATDALWAEWIAWELGRAGYTYRLQAEHFPPGSRFIQGMRQWLDRADHLLAILSPAYFEAPYTSLEINSAVAEDPLGLARRVIPVRVADCVMPALFRDLVYIDFVGKSEHAQRRALAAGVQAALLATPPAQRQVKTRPRWPGPDRAENTVDGVIPTRDTVQRDGPVRIQFIACDVNRGLDLKGQYAKIHATIAASRFGQQMLFHPEFDVNDTNLFAKLNGFHPHVVHVSGNQFGGDVLLPAADGGETVVSDAAFAGLLSSLGSALQLAIIDTCHSYACARRIAEVVPFAIGVDDLIYDVEATRFYDIFYQALGAGHSIADAHGQATAALRFQNVPASRIPQLVAKPDADASRTFLVGPQA